MKEGTETALYNQGYMDGFDDAQKSHIEPIKPKIKDVKEKSFPKDDADYWTCLEHQYAGMAMQGIISNPEVNLDYKSDECMPQALAATAYNLAHALVEKMKESI